MIFNLNNFISRSTRNQFISACCVNLITISHGIVLGWLSPALPKLKSENSPLDSGPVNVEEVSWIGAFVCVGGFTGNLIFGFLNSKAGRKTSIILLAFPQIGFWICVFFGTLQYHLYIARFLGGITGGGIFITIPLYIADIAEDRIRGSLGSLLITTCSLGNLIGYIVGAQISYFILPKFAVLFPILFAIGFLLFPETPQFLLKNNKIQEAEQSLKFYRGIRKSETLTKEFNEEFLKLKNQVFNSANKTNETKVQWADFTTKAARKGLLIGFALMVLNQFSGCFVILNYTASIFQESGSDLSPNMAAIVVGVIQLFGSYISTILVDRAGRKILLIISSFGTSIGLAVFGTYSYLSKNNYDVSSFGLVPVISMSFVVFIAYLGIITLPFVVLAEVLPSKIRSFGSGLCMILINILAFCTLKFFPILVVIIELSGCMFLFSLVCFIGTIFIIFVLPETNGKSLNPNIEISIIDSPNLKL